MMYMVVHWIGDRYEILHYSHLFDDAIEQYERLKKLHDNIIMMTDVRIVHMYENMVKVKEMQEHLKRKKNEKLSAS